jgi:hypothetical protein
LIDEDKWVEDPRWIISRELLNERGERTPSGSLRVSSA